MSAQDQALRTDAYKVRIEKTEIAIKCHLCKEAEDILDHLVSYCKLAQSDYKQWHDNVAAGVHWNICGKYHLPAN